MSIEWVGVEWKPQDLWLGAFWKTTPAVISATVTAPFITDLWVCVVPCLPLHWRIHHVLEIEP